MASESQRLARKRRKERQRSLMAEGKKATDTMGSAERQVVEAAEKVARLEAEAAEARSALGIVTADLAKARQDLAVEKTLREGLEVELETASVTVNMAEHDRDQAQESLGKLVRKMSELQRADMDARPLRNRLKAKSDEIIRLGGQIRRLKEFLDRHNLLKAWLNQHPEAEVPPSVPEEKTPVPGPAAGQAAVSASGQATEQAAGQASG